MKDFGGYFLFHVLGLVLIIGTQSFSSLSFTRRSPNTGLCATLSREKRISGLSQWGNENDIKTGGIAIQSIQDSGLGLVTQQQVPSNSLVVTVPTKATLSVTTPGGPDDSSVVSMCSDRQSFRSLPWFCQFSLYLYKLNKISSVKESENLDLQPWLESLPRKFDTPIHWKKSQRDELLQYQHISESVDRQEEAWTDLFKKLKSCANVDITWSDFLLYCEIARSRAFSGGYTGSPFNPLVYAFTLLLVTVYAGLNLGTLEQASNGAALVLCASVLRDFVLPKLFKTKKYVICPIIDMANHKSLGSTGNVAYEFFSDAYSLAANVQIEQGSEIFISYGERSNDQLLQYYGFVEPDNPFDVYIMPPIRDWNVAALEEACGGPFAAGRLGKLERAGLLGKAVDSSASSDDYDEASGNPRGGVVLTRSGGVDPAVIQALRALVSTKEEWELAGEAVGNFASVVSSENEARARLAARTALEMELAAKETSLEEDQELLKRMESSNYDMENEERLSLMFRIEKKKILKDSIKRLQ